MTITNPTTTTGPNPPSRIGSPTPRVTPTGWTRWCRNVRIGGGGAMIDDEDGNVFRALLVAVPAGALMWAFIIWLVARRG